MRIKFVTLNQEFAQRISKIFPTYLQDIKDYVEEKGRHTFYVSPANSLGWMDAGIDASFVEMFPDIGKKVRKKIKKHGKMWKNNFKYLPVGSAMLVPIDKNRSLICSPTMMVPQNVQYTQNCYYAVMATLYLVRNVRHADIILTSFCCGCGEMSPKESVRQICRAIRDYKMQWDYKTYKPDFVSQTVVLHEPNLDEQTLEYPFKIN